MDYNPSTTPLSTVMAVDFLNYLHYNEVYEPGGEASKADLRQIFIDEYRPEYRSKYKLRNNWNFGSTMCALLRGQWIHRVKPHAQDTVFFTTKNIDLPNTVDSPDDDAAPLATGFSLRGRQSVDQFITRNRTQAEQLLSGSGIGSGAPPAPKTRSSSLAGPTQGERYCGLCQKNMDSETNRQEHLNSRGHRLQVILLEIKNNRPQLMEDKEGVKVTSSHDDSCGQYMSVEIEEGDSNIPEVKILIENDESDVILTHCELLKRPKGFSLDDLHQVSERKCTVTIPKGGEYAVTMTIDFSQQRWFPRRQSNILVFTFNKSGRTFNVIRYVKVLTINDTIRELGPTGPYRPPRRVTLKGRDPRVEQVEGEPLPSLGNSSLEREVELKPYRIPGNLRSLINKGLKNNADDIRALLKADLTFANHQEKFSLLMHIEELQMEVDIRKYDIEDATMTICDTNKRLLSLKVPGLAENRPSILKGDHLFVRKLGADKRPERIEYKGYVHEVWQNEVHLGFHNQLRDLFVENMRFSVRFTFNRLPAMLAHRAVELCATHSLQDVVFPTPPRTDNPQPVNTNIRLFDRKLESNQEQVRAVQHMIAGTSIPAPYLLFGPPGTGKTVTVVEAIKQIVRGNTRTRVLACAPSNSAADLLAQRLKNHLLNKREIFRMYAMSRPLHLVPEDIKNISNYDMGNAYFPCKEDLKPYKVIVCTIVTAGRLASAQFPADHFSHVVIDEAGHAVEPEALIAVAGVLARQGGQVILAGDPKQLGPVLRSPWTIQYGLGMSFLERLMIQCGTYQRHPNGAYDPCLITKLVRNYRSHPAILKVPNELFYDNELEPHADQLSRESLCHWEKLPRKGFPIIFHGVMGEDLREERSPSFFNPQEVDQVLQYVKALLEARTGGINVQPKDIGVITPYRKQVEKIRTVLKPGKKLKISPNKDLKDIKVGSVEEFQGQERKVIIISTVRSSPEFLTVDADFKLGFLTNPKRFNVALTRAQALLIIIGNPHLLKRDEHWNRFLTYCLENRAYIGCDFEETTETEVADMEQLLCAMKLENTDNADEGGLQINPGDQEWRRSDD